LYSMGQRGFSCAGVTRVPKYGSYWIVFEKTDLFENLIFGYCKVLEGRVCQ